MQQVHPQQPINNYPPNNTPQVGGLYPAQQFNPQQQPSLQPQQYNNNGIYQNNMQPTTNIILPQQQQQPQSYTNNGVYEEPLTHPQRGKNKKNKKNKNKNKKRKEKDHYEDDYISEEYSDSGSSSYYDGQDEGWDILDSLPGIFIEQKMEMLEVLLDIETKNSYNIYATDENGKKEGERLFKAKENSSFLMRMLCPGNQRPFTMKLKKTVGKYDDVIAFGERKYACSFYCYNRPEIKLYEGNGKDKQSYIGKIKHLWSCCTLTLQITDENDNPIYYIEGSELQLGVCCSNCCCTPCQEAKFKILDADRHEVSSIQKKSSGCINAMVSDQDFFSMIFPRDATPGDKALLLMAGILIDFQYFERNPQDDSNDHNNDVISDVISNHYSDD